MAIRLLEGVGDGPLPSAMICFMKLDNPAARLHVFLSAYLELADTQKSMYATWAEALQLDGPDVVRVRLGEIAGLVGDIRRQIIALDDDELLDRSSTLRRNS